MVPSCEVMQMGQRRCRHGTLNHQPHQWHGKQLGNDCHHESSLGPQKSNAAGCAAKWVLPSPTFQQQWGPNKAQTAPAPQACMLHNFVDHNRAKQNRTGCGRHRPEDQGWQCLHPSPRSTHALQHVLAASSQQRKNLHYTHFGARTITFVSGSKVVGSWSKGPRRTRKRAPYIFF